MKKPKIKLGDLIILLEESFFAGYEAGSKHGLSKEDAFSDWIRFESNLHRLTEENAKQQ